MINVKDIGEQYKTEIKGTMTEILTELTYLIRNLKKGGIPKEFIMASVKIGLEEKIKENED